ncbi:HNH endonuclease domain-containing protein [Priestia koreensis]|uniref:HNH endonuclease domain-containing protein n=1 Tax=Priestia koreensis TaxID=284581 RepID=UPI00203A4F5B|nr:HNH endonuclease domain-containing protein [Priestia koreensis]MCM3006866.1 HNH endonuclease [Priestia koreensis]
MNQFIIDQPTLDSYFRGVILFGKNVASYKFALGKSLIDLAVDGKDFVSEKELAIPFVQYTNEHFQNGTKQITSNSSSYFNSFQKYNEGTATLEEMVKLTISNPFKNVIDRFHVVNDSELNTKFYERTTRNGVKGIVLTDNVFKLKEQSNFDDLVNETEARWRLVETAWTLKINPAMLNVRYDDQTDLFFINTTQNDLYKRIDITSSREALNGYQRGKCFYCDNKISINPLDDALADVDHFIPHTLQTHTPMDININGVWNLVLSCKECNRGPEGKFAKVPKLNFLEKLHRRNEYFINSHHPLRETLLNQCGKKPQERFKYLNDIYNHALSILLFTWEPKTMLHTE